MPMGVPAEAVGELSLDERVLEAARACCERWGRAKVTVDDIASEAGTSRATIYRLFPGGRDALFEAMRARQTTEFFDQLAEHVAAASTLEGVVVAALVSATRLLRDDEQLQLMLASTPGDVVTDLTVDGLPNIVGAAQAFFGPLLAEHVGHDRADELAEWLSRVVISYFLAPSPYVDLADPTSAAAFTQRFILPAFPVRR